MHRIAPLFAIFVMSACSSSAPPVPVLAPAEEAPAERQIPNDLHWVRNSAEYRAIFHQAYALAGRELERLAAGRKPGTWAVALDADETVISNRQYQKEIFEHGRAYSRETWNAWVRRREATALPGARAFLEKARALGGKVAIVTNRRAEVCAATEANFLDLELPFDVILCRTGERSKEPRWESVEAGTTHAGLAPLEILMWLGDNIEDFPAWGQDKRDGPDETFEAFGRKLFVVPNPMYGSWQANPSH